MWISPFYFRHEVWVLWIQESPLINYELSSGRVKGVFSFYIIDGHSLLLSSVVLYAIFASYFAGVMVRLMLTLTPVVCVLAAIAFSKTFEVYLKDDSPKSSQKSGDENGENKNDRLYDKVQLNHG